MSGNTLDFDNSGALNDQGKIGNICDQYERWKSAKVAWENQTLENRNYLFATSTKTTQNNKLDFSNSTTVPKLAQIVETLHAKYMKALFSVDPLCIWEASNPQSADKDKAAIIQGYMITKIQQQQMLNQLKLIVRDWIQYGNGFGELIYVNEKYTNPKTGQPYGGYQGPKLFRVSPYDINFNLLGTSFQSSPKIIRYLKSIGELHAMVTENPEYNLTESMIASLNKKNMLTYGQYGGYGRPESQKSNEYMNDGFAAYHIYQSYQYVELIEFRGDLFFNGVLYKNHIVTILNRQYILRDEPSKSWTGSSYLYHASWRDRPDNLMGFGPIDNLIGMQYKLDKMENQFADIVDQFAQPVEVRRGDVELIGKRGEPGAVYQLAEDADLTFLRPDTIAFQLENKLMQTMGIMDNLSNIPPESSGFRQPGEKTFGEVSILMSNAGDSFDNKVQDFERMFFEPMLNDMLEMSRRMLIGSDIIKQQDNTFGADKFLTITADDLMAEGKLLPMGSRYAALHGQLLSNLSAVFNPNVYPIIKNHVNGLAIAQMISQLSGLDKFNIIQENIAISQDFKAQQAIQTAQNLLQKSQAASQAPIDHNDTPVNVPTPGGNSANENPILA
jgi:hypothetical protein